MKILELGITEFGNLKNKRIAFGESLNLILGDNESGKSTIARFIKFIFYGLPRKTLSNFDRELALSRDSNRAEGWLTLTHNGETYKIERAAIMGARRQLNDSFRILHLPLGEDISSKGEPWEIFLGVDSDVFESSCFIRQLRVGEINGAKAAGAIENMLSSADESIDVGAATTKLEALRKTYRHKTGSGGSIPKLHEEISVLKERLRSATANHLRLGELTSRLADNTSLRDSISAEIKKSDMLIEQMKNAERLKDFKALRIAEAELAAAEAKQKALIDENTREGKLPTQDLVSALKRATENYAEAVSDADRAEEAKASLYASAPYDPSLILKAEEIERDGGEIAITEKLSTLSKKIKSAAATATALLILGLLGGSLLISLSFVLKSIFTILIAGGAGTLILLVALSMALFASSGKKSAEQKAISAKYGCTPDELPSLIKLLVAEVQKKNKYEDELRDADRLLSMSLSRVESKRELLANALSDIGVSVTDDLPSTAEAEFERSSRFLETLSSLWSDILVKRSRVDHIKKSLEGYSEEELRASVSEDIIDVTPEEIEKALRTRSFNANKLSTLERDIIDTTNKIATLKATDSDPLALADKISALEDKYKSDDEFCSALDLAIEEITKAGEAIRAGVTPTISRRAGEMLGYVSNGKYEKLYTDKQMELSTESESGYTFASHMLSGGTKDVAYLCLRISLMMQLFSEGIPPLILDEALTQLDGKRAEATMKLLDKLTSEGLQTIVFSCHTREEEISDRIGISPNVIRL